MKKLLTLLVLSVLFLSIPLFAKEQKTVRVGYFRLVNYNEGLEGERKNGLGYEYLQKISSITGWNYEYVYGNFSNILEMLKNGDIDIMGDISYTDERAQYFNYSDYSIGTEDYCICVLSDIPDFTPGDSSWFNHKKIGAMASSLQYEKLSEWIKKHNLQAEIKIFTSNEEMFEALNNHKIDATAIATEQTEDSWVQGISLGYSDVYFVINKNRNDLLQELNEALLYIQQTTPTYNELLQTKYFQQANSAKRIMSAVEKEYIQNTKAIRVGYLKNNIPYSFFNEETLQPEGLIPYFVETLKKELNIQDLEIEYLPFDTYYDALAGFKTQEYDILFPLYTDLYAAERMHLILSESIISEIPTLVYKDSINPNTTKILAVLQNSPMWYYALNRIPDCELIPCKTIDDCIYQLKKKKANGILLDNYTAMQLANQYPDFNLIVFQTHAPLSFAVNKTDTELLRIINRVISFLDEDTLSFLTTSYLSSTLTYTSQDFVHDHLFQILSTCFVLLILLLITSFLLVKSYKKVVLANKSKSSFLFNMSHDIRTPMNAITGYTTIAKSNITDSKRISDCLNKIEISSKHLLTIINQVLDMARIESGKAVLEEKPANLIERANAMLAIIANAAQEKDITLKKEAYITNTQVYADIARMNQIILNILNNAVKYTEPGGTITYRIEELGSPKNGYSTFRFTTIDTGIGMSQEFLKHIYDNFSRERNTTQSGIEGTGLGMAIVKRIVDMMNGTIEIYSEKGKGTTVQVSVPLKIMLEKPTEQKTSLQADIAMLSGKRVLIVEDNEMNREIAVELITEAGLVCEEAENGVIAVEKVKKSKPGYYFAVLMDIQMPIMDGYQATRQIRNLEDKDLAGIPIIAMTANAFEEDKINAFNAGMNDHVAKPIDLQILLHALSKQAEFFYN